MIHYGSYLDALESSNYKSGRKQLVEDGKLEADGMLVPEFSPKLVTNPELYTVIIPDIIEKEVFCINCGEIVVSGDRSDKVKCPCCEQEIIRYADFIDEVTL